MMSAREQIGSLVFGMLLLLLLTAVFAHKQNARVEECRLPPDAVRWVAL